MPVIPEAVIEDVRARTDIVQVIGDRVPLKRAGAAWKACCPFHNEKTPSFTVNPQRQSFKCFGCGEGGDVFKFLMKHDGMSFVDAVRYLAEKCGVEIVAEEDDGRTARAKRLFQINAEAAAFFHRCLLKTKGAEPARAYLERRKLDAATVEAFQLGYDPDEWGALDEFARRNRFTPEEMVAAGLGTLPDRPGASANLRDRFHGRLMFPICDQTGRVVAFSGRILDAAKSPAKYVNSPETDVFKKARVLYALDKAQRHIASSPHREAIVCEGQIDVIRCHACGFPRAVASEGTAFTPEHARLLHRSADSVVELFDADAAGRKAAVRTAAILLAEGLAVRVAEMPAGEDPDSFLLKNPPEAFQRMLDDAVGIVPFHVAFLRAQERDPDGADAAARIVQGVLQTVAACRNAVQKARMLQEVASLMNLPESAIRDELAGVEEALRRQEQSAARRAERMQNAECRMPNEKPAAAPSPPVHPSGSAPKGTAQTTGGAHIQHSAFSTQHSPAEPPPEIFDDPSRDASDIQHSALGTQHSSPAEPDALDVALCEFLLNHCLEEPGTLNALSKHLPAAILPSPLVRRIAVAFYASVGASTDPVYDLQQSDPAVASFLGTVAARHDRTGTSENFLAKDVAHDLVLAAWRRHLQARLAEATPARGEEDTPEKMRRRMEIRATVRKLRDWTRGEAAVRVLAGIEDSHAESAEGAETKPHAESAETAEPNPRAESAVPNPHAETAESAEPKPHAESAETAEPKPHAESAEFAESGGGASSPSEPQFVIPAAQPPARHSGGAAAGPSFVISPPAVPPPEETFEDLPPDDL